jgi:hypothetical protein
MFDIFQYFKIFEPLPAGEFGTGGLLQPIALTSPLGVVFVSASGAVLVRGTKRVAPQES